MRTAFFGTLALLAAALSTRDARAEGPPPAPTAQRAYAALEAGFGGAMRVGESDTGYAVDERAGVAYRFAALFSPTPRFAFGLGYQHLDLGADLAPTDAESGALRARRSLHALEASVRVFPFSPTAVVRPFLALGFGPSFQHVEASGATTAAPFAPTRPLRCAATGSAALALGGGAGVVGDLGDGFALVARADASSHHASTDALGDESCAPGLGTATVLSASLSLAYRFELAGAAL